MTRSDPTTRPLAAAATPLLIAASAAISLAATAAAAQPERPIPYPHPVIMEVLFNVPPGAEGDANQDGARDATGDEFIEIMNPHDRPIDLAGYILTDRNPEPARQLRFVFPPCRLAPGQVAVVFNGHKSEIPGPVGDADAAPRAGNERFGGALVFTMRIDSSQRALGNSGDFILLSAPDAAPIDAVVWGDSDPAPPESALRITTVAGAKGSVQRLTPSGDMTPHTKINGALFSPGVIPEPDS